MNWCCLTLEEVKGLNASGFLIMTLAFIFAFIFFQGAGQARLNSPKALIWLHVSSFTRWDPNTKAGTAQQLRVLYTAVTGTSCSLQSKHAAAYVRVCYPWHICSGYVGLHRGQMVVNIFSWLVDLAKYMKASVVSWYTSCLLLSVLWCRWNVQRDLSCFKSWTSVARAAQRSGTLRRSRVDSYIGFCAMRSFKWASSSSHFVCLCSHMDLPSGRSDCWSTRVFGLSAFIQQPSETLSQGVSKCTVAADAYVVFPLSSVVFPTSS